MLKVKNELRLLRQRNDTLLLLVGEKEEELEDATASLREVKLLYRQQIELLVSKNERLIHWLYESLNEIAEFLKNAADLHMSD